MDIQLSIEKLEHIILLAKEQQKTDSSLSSTLQFSLIDKSDTHLGDDHVAVWQQSAYAECDGKLLYNHWIPVNA